MIPSDMYIWQHDTRGGVLLGGPHTPSFYEGESSTVYLDRIECILAYTTKIKSTIAVSMHVVEVGTSYCIDALGSVNGRGPKKVVIRPLVKASEYSRLELIKGDESIYQFTQGPLYCPRVHMQILSSSHDLSTSPQPQIPGRAPIEDAVSIS